MEPFAEMIDALALPFMQRAIAGSVLVGLLCAALGVFVVLQNLALIGQGIAHGALPGLALGFWLRLNLYLSALVTAVALAIAIAYLRERARIGTDTAIAIAFSVAAAAGVALIAAVRFGPVDVNAYLFGNVLAIGDADLVVLAVTALAIGALLLALSHDLAHAAFDPESAAAAGVPVRRNAYLFLVMIAAAVVVSLQTVGLIMVTALLVLPAAAARQWVDRLPGMFALAAAFGVAGSLAGLAGSFVLRLPSGATIVLALGAIFAVSLAARSLREARGRRLLSD